MVCLVKEPGAFGFGNRNPLERKNFITAQGFQRHRPECHSVTGQKWGNSSSINKVMFLWLFGKTSLYLCIPVVGIDHVHSPVDAAQSQDRLLTPDSSPTERFADFGVLTDSRKYVFYMTQCSTHRWEWVCCTCIKMEKKFYERYLSLLHPCDLIVLFYPVSFNVLGHLLS